MKNLLERLADEYFGNSDDGDEDALPVYRPIHPNKLLDKFLKAHNIHHHGRTSNTADNTASDCVLVNDQDSKLSTENVPVTIQKKKNKRKRKKPNRTVNVESGANTNAINSGLNKRPKINYHKQDNEDIRFDDDIRQHDQSRSNAPKQLGNEQSKKNCFS